MKIYLSHAASNEEGKTAGGKPGDQTGREVRIDEFFEYNWNWILRAKDASVREKLAEGAEVLAKNDFVGYDHPDRYSMYLQAKSLNYDFSRISTPCNTDCSQMVATLINSCKINLSPYIFTGNMADYIVNTGKFDKLAYYNKSQLRRGDILLSVDKGHVVTIIQAASDDPTPSSTPKWVGEVYGAKTVDVKSEPNSKAKNLSNWPRLALGNLVDVCDERDEWCYIRIAAKYYGWVLRDNLLRKTPYAKGTVSTDLHLRTGAGVINKSLKIMPAKAKIDICDEKLAANGAKWYYVIYNGVYGFCSARYIK